MIQVVLTYISSQNTKWFCILFINFMLSYTKDKPIYSPWPCSSSGPPSLCQSWRCILNVIYSLFSCYLTQKISLVCVGAAFAICSLTSCYVTQRINLFIHLDLVVLADRLVCVGAGVVFSSSDSDALLVALLREVLDAVAVAFFALPLYEHNHFTKV